MGHRLLLSPIPTRACYIIVQQLFSFCYYNNKRIRLSHSLTHNRRTRNHGPVQLSILAQHTAEPELLGNEDSEATQWLPCMQTPALEAPCLLPGTLSFWTQIVMAIKNKDYILSGHQYLQKYNTDKSLRQLSASMKQAHTSLKTPVLRLLWFILK